MSETGTVNLSRDSVRDIARAFADELNGGGYNRTTGGAGTTGTGGQSRRISGDLVESLFKDLVPGFNRSFAQMANGATGLSSFNSAIEGSTATLDKLAGGLLTKMPGLAQALGVTTAALSSYVQQVNQLADAQYDAYTEFSKVGAADRVSGLGNVMDMLNKFGYASARDFPKLTAYINENATAFAAFNGTVEGGMKEVSNVTAIMHKTGMQAELMQMGINPDEMNKRFAALLKNVQMAGGSIANLGKTEEDRARSVKEFIKQQDIVTRLTGLSAEQQQKALERAMANDRYAALRVQQQIELENAKAAGDTELVNKLTMAMEKQDSMIKFAAGIGPEFEQGMQDAFTGFTTDASAKLERTIGTSALEAATAIPNSMKELNEQFVQVGSAARKAATESFSAFAVNTQAGQTGVVLNPREIANLRKFGGMSKEALAEAYAQQGEAKPGTGGTPQPSETALINVVAVRQEVMRATSAFENFVNAGLKPISDIMVGAAAGMRGVLELLPGSTPQFLKDNPALKKQMENETGINVAGTMGGTKEFIAEERTTLNKLQTKVTETADSIAEDAKKQVKKLDEFLEELGKKIQQRIGIPLSSNNTTANDLRTTMLNATSSMFAGAVQEVSPILRTNINSSRMLNDFKNAAGPADRYRQTLIDTVYRPDTENNDTKLADTSGALTGVGTVTENMFRDQMAAYETMIKQQGELIDLLQRSIGIQDKTLRATYNT